MIQKLKDLADYSEDDNIQLQSVKELGKAIGTVGNTIKQKEIGVVGMFQGFRTLRLADGPDEVHRILIAKEILKKYHDGLSWDFGV